MQLESIKKTFESKIPDELTNNLLESYKNALRQYSRCNWQYFINEIGQFNEIVFRILEYLLTGKYTDIKDKLPQFNENILIKWENIPNKDENVRIIIPRVLYSMFCLRNKRGAIHKNDISPNKMDATILLYNAKWIFAELFRIFSKLSNIESQAVIDSIINRESDLLWKINDKNRILDCKMKFTEQILVLLYSNNEMTVEKLLEDTEYSNKTYFRSILMKLHKDRMIEFDGEKCIISPKGSTEAEIIIKSK